ncbi:MAG: PspA/IM30 family protein [Motiliproteus sp.]|nr:PspA/IM30 family protein [Motiliproteus sp.]MCW9053904.1 PspA/IM30 family protein [Motiliproteus sp.]
MKTRRIITAIGASIDSFVSKVENHEAVADCAIADVRGAAATLKVQQGKTLSQLQRIQQQVNEQQQFQQRWQKRALKFADQDRSKALQCIKQGKEVQQRIERLQYQQEQYQNMVGQLTRNLEEVEARLEQLQIKKTTLSSRSARNSAFNCMNNHSAVEETEQLFERWEAKVLKDEYQEGVVDIDANNQFEQQIVAEEEAEALELELDALMSEQSSGKQE